MKNRHPERWDGLPPHDFDAEEAVIGCLCLDLGDHDTADVIFSEMRSEDLYRDKHRWCFEACERLHEEGKPLDQLTIASELTRRYPSLEKDAPGWARDFLGHCISIVPTTVHARFYARLVHYLGCKRRGEPDDPLNGQKTGAYRGLAL